MRTRLSLVRTGRLIALGVAGVVSVAPAPGAEAAPAQAAAFAAFAPKVATRWDETFLYVESEGLPDHRMMVGITAWQQQVPLPQPYRGANAWRIPLRPVPAKTPVAIKGRFLRGAIALAANGIPIFNPQNNRGEISLDIGELDQWGGHCGRADDYHYHVAPLHLQRVLGPERPIAYALDGYPIYGLTEPDGSSPSGLDAYNGHERTGIGYHYHASLKYPFVNGGFHGEIRERDGQVDPQPRAQGVRPALNQLRGAEITDFKTLAENRYELSYVREGRTHLIRYAVKPEGGADFEFTENGETRFQSFKRRSGGSGSGGSGSGGSGGGGGGEKGGGQERVRENPPGGARAPGFSLRSPAIGADGVLPVEFTGDGASISPPLEWSGAPEGTRSYALIMHHLDPTGATKWYWTLYNIPAELRALPKAVKDVGRVGNNSVNRRVGYAPPHSKGPGAKSYVLTLYALTEPLELATSPAETNRDVLLAAMKDRVLAQTELTVVYTRAGEGDDRRAADGTEPVRKGRK